MEHGQQEAQPSIALGRTWYKFPEDMSQRDILQRHYGNHQRIRTAEPDRAYSISFRLTWSKPTQLSSGLTTFRNQQISGQESSLFTIPGSFQEKTGIQSKIQEIFHPKAERVRPHDPEAVGIGKKSAQEPYRAVNTSRSSSPNNRNIIPTKNEHSVVTTESNFKIDALWLCHSHGDRQGITTHC
ncbi:hypothetical protein O181_021647 [Austropuccinia psidii MF-1]|uniref:Uncharacterized protein n=1 Tax=Austropuccinia psidii MF-1 TaxID=1389203 RepID=A0A9Q3GWF4_9BASI|nr:hypothetical protein [Austropuccinia psidii MF-1]